MTTGLLKIIALAFMFIDHIGEFMPHSPIWLRYLGRLSAPIFFYCSAIGFSNTRNRKIYLIRLYCLGILMSCGNTLISYFIGKGEFVTNNIFTTLFLACMIVFIWEISSDWCKRIKYFFCFMAFQLISFFTCALFAEFLSIPNSIDTYMLYYNYGAIFGSCIFTEGSILFILYFVGIYFLRENAYYLSCFHAGYSVFLYFLIRHTSRARGPLEYLVPFNSFQWLMVLSIPFFFLYNGKKGKGMKWFYYIFYPLHIWFLYIIGCYYR